MARPQKCGVEYFSHDTSSGKTIFTLEAKFGNDGYAFWFKLLEILGTQKDLCFRVVNPADWMFLCAKTRVSEETATEILNMLAALGAIDDELWTQKIIWSQNFVSRLSSVYEKRKENIPVKPSFRSVNSTITDVSSSESTQSKVKESKVKETKVKEIKESIDNSCCYNAPEREKSPEEEAVSQVMNYYLDKINASPSSTSSEELLSYIPTLSHEVVIKAMSIAVDENKRQWSYIRAILQNWAKLGVKTLDDVQRIQNERDEAKAETQAQRSNNSKAEKTPKYITAASYKPPTGRDDSALMRQLLDKRRQSNQSEGFNSG